MVVKAIVNHPNDVKTERTVDERGVLITLHINQEDMGYVIGREGQTARSLRILLKIVGAKNNARVNLKIWEPEGSRRGFRGPENSMGQSGASHGGMSPSGTSRSLEDVDTSTLDDLNI